MEPAPAATVVLLRDAPGAFEVLLVRRNAGLAFHGGAWVFPGGRVDPADERGDGPLAAARRAAVREAREEAGVEVDEAGLVPLVHMTTPEGRVRRFATWFFVARAPAGEVAVDGDEIHDHAWIAPAATLADGRELPRPTLATLQALAAHGSVDAVLEDARSREPPVFP